MDSYNCAISKLKNNEYDILLLDLDVEDLNESQDTACLSDLISETTRSFVSVLMLSRDCTPDTVAFAFKKGAIDFIPKNDNLRYNLKEKILLYMEERISLVDQSDENQGSIIVDNLRILLRIAHLDENASETILTPIELVIKTISALLEGNFSSHQQRILLSGTLRSLIKSQNVYRPQLKETSNSSPWFTPDYLNAIKSNNLFNGGYSLLKKSSEEIQVDLSNNYSFPPKIQEEYEIETLHSFDFDMFQYNTDRLTKSIVQMFEKFDLIREFKIDVGKLISFINEIRGKYLPNLYHNYEHALDVVQFTFAMLHDPSVSKVLNSPLDRFAALIAALGHDVGHEGVNNNFQKRTHSQLALLYNDEHCLEHYHCSTLFTLLRKSRFQILEHLTEEEYTTFREFVINAILCTDPERHFEILAKFNSSCGAGEIEPTKENKKLVLAMVVKSADISNVARPFYLAEKWAERVILEFLSQGDKEASLGLSVNSLNDRTKANKSQLQMGFIKFFATPLFESMANIFPTLKPIKEQVEENHKRWTEINRKEEETGVRPRYDLPATETQTKIQRKNLLTITDYVAEIKSDGISGISILCISPYSESIDIFRELLLSYMKFYSEVTVEDAIQVIKNHNVSMIIVEEDSSLDIKKLIEASHEKQIPIFMVSDGTEVPIGVTEFATKPIHLPSFYKHCDVCINQSLERSIKSDLKESITSKGYTEVENFLLLAEESSRKIFDSQADVSTILKEAKNLKIKANAIGLRSIAYSALDLEFSCDAVISKVEIPVKILALKRRIETCIKALKKHETKSE